ncbi:MAG: hypothetical protein E6929_03810 [Clostridium sp.]|nr:hypothetical protein [Clostridium sp.]
MIKTVKFLLENYANEEEIINFTFGCSYNDINEIVVVAPNWITIFDDYVDEIIEVSKGTVFNVKYNSIKFTLIRTPMSAAFVGDTILGLSVTNCKKVIFVGSVGGLDINMKIGDVIIPEYSVCGEGFSRFLTPDLKDCFGEKYYADKELNSQLFTIANKFVHAPNKIWSGKVFSIDTILGEYININKIVNLNCNCIEMETSAFFNAAQLCNLNASALLMVIDNTVSGNSLLTLLSDEEKKLKHYGKFNTIPKILLETLTKI